ncbi:MAG: hypothetical protein NZ651_02460 [Candidatus Bipolaricaulota bacterium]|nr:hypothetical protein [Candidatus Bipolaricaulota bacterium]MDW8126619.1 hypothetical protein [Candidatus Bipolaricaulota bacterium]
MRKFWVFPILSVCVGVSLYAASITLESSTFTPDPGNTVSLFVRGAPLGASFLWDLDGDGSYERTTQEPQTTFVMAEGVRPVRVEVVSGGKSLTQFKVIFVADKRLGATRTVVLEGTSYLVTICVAPKTTVIAPGIIEEIPSGFGVEVVANDGAFWRRAERLEAVWPLILDPGQTVSFSYRLYPLAGVSFQFSGLVSAYAAGKRVEIPIAGVAQP